MGREEEKKDCALLREGIKAKYRYFSLSLHTRYTITTDWMTSGADGNRRSPCRASCMNAEAHWPCERSVYSPLSGSKKEDMPWNLLALRTRLRNWSRPAPA